MGQPCTRDDDVVIPCTDGVVVIDRVSSCHPSCHFSHHQSTSRDDAARSSYHRLTPPAPHRATRRTHRCTHRAQPRTQPCASSLSPYASSNRPQSYASPRVPFCVIEDQIIPMGALDQEQHRPRLSPGPSPSSELWMDGGDVTIATATSVTAPTTITTASAPTAAVASITISNRIVITTNSAIRDPYHRTHVIQMKSTRSWSIRGML